MSAVRPAIDRPSSRALDAADALARSIEEGSGRLSRELKEGMLEGDRAADVSRGPSTREAALAEFALRLARAPLAIRAAEVESLRGLACDEEILEAVLTAGVARPPANALRRPGEPDVWAPFPGPEPLAPPDGSPRPYLRAASFKPGEFAPFEILRERLGFVPALYKAQTLWPAALDCRDPRPSRDSPRGGLPVPPAEGARPSGGLRSPPEHLLRRSPVRDPPHPRSAAGGIRRDRLRLSGSPASRRRRRTLLDAAVTLPTRRRSRPIHRVRRPS